MGDLGTGLDWTGANSWCCSRSAIPSRDNPISFHFLILFFSETPSSFDYFPFFFRLLLLRDECSHVLKNKNLRGKRKKEFSARLTHTFSSFYRFLCMICARDAMRCARCGMKNNHLLPLRFFSDPSPPPPPPLLRLWQKNNLMECQN